MKFGSVISTNFEIINPMIITSFFFCVKNSGTQNEWKNADALVLTNGTTDEEIIYKKSTAIQVWLFGFEMENTVVVVTDKKVLILTGPETGK